MPQNRRKKNFPLIDGIQQQALYWALGYDHLSYYNPNGYKVPHHPFLHFLAVEAEEIFVSNDNTFQKLRKFASEPAWITGFFSYDLKNELEKLESRNPSSIPTPHASFFKPRHLIFFGRQELTIESADPDRVMEEILSTNIPGGSTGAVELKPQVSREEYFKIFDRIHKHIIDGDVYELTYCMEFLAHHELEDPIAAYLRLNEQSPMPFSTLQKFDDLFLISASPERFLKKDGERLISQPIKGTRRRGRNAEEDFILKNQLFTSIKERAENMMIVDLVRNDLARNGAFGSIEVEELFGIYSYPGVHQMISTITGGTGASDAFDNLANAFPMGSMTGAPKIRAMQIIEEVEHTHRNLFSGSAGYFTPSLDFDFNVVIRSIIYSAQTKALSFHVGSAITSDAVAHEEYEECLIKAAAILNSLNASK